MIKGRVAQGLEHMATNYGVGGSNPSLPNFCLVKCFYKYVIIVVYNIKWDVAKW